MPLVLALLVWASPAGAVPTIQAVRVAPGRIEPDGRLDEPEWQSAPVGRGFVERTPVAGAPAPVESEVRVLTDGASVFVAVTMNLLPGEVPRALEMTRDDTRIWDDDAVTLKFDVQHDHRSTAGFAVNPAGAQLDYLALDGGRSMLLEHDAVWQCGTSVGARAWIAEFALPVAALGLAPAAGDRVLGFEVSRDHPARRATYDWSPIPPEFGAMSALHYGELRGLGAIAGGRPFAIVPYGLVAAPGSTGSVPVRLRAGTDLQLRLAEDLWTEVTVLTDFAQADIDDQVVNLDRFPLQLPEKRPFFLAGLDAFDFGHPQVSNAQLFFSRRIGLDGEGHEVPILAGLKQHGHIGPLTLGLLDVLTLSTDDVAAANWSVARVSAEVARGLEVGGIGTARTDVPDLSSGDAQPRADAYAGGIDGALSAAEGRLQLHGFWAGSHRGDQNGGAARTSIAWMGEELEPHFWVLYVSDGFDPPVGFVRQPGITRADLLLPWTYRTPAPGIDELGFDMEATIDGSDEMDRVLHRELQPDAWITLRSGWTFVVGAELAESLVEEAFEVVPGVEVQAGRYRGRDVFGKVYSPGTRNPRGDVLYATGDVFYGGFFHKIEASAALSLTGHLRLSVSTELFYLDLPTAAPFWTTTLNARATVAISPALFADVIVGGQTEDDTGVGYLRIRWRYRPGSDLFLVYREDVSFGDRWSSERSVALKLSARFDALL